MIALQRPGRFFTDSNKTLVPLASWGAAAGAPSPLSLCQRAPAVTVRLGRNADDALPFALI